MEIVINACYGVFRLSNKAVERYYELKCKPVYFYTRDNNSKFFIKTDSNSAFAHAYSEDFGDRVPDDCINKYCIDITGDIDRTDPVLIKVIKELRDEATGYGASLRIVEIPDDVNWIIEEHDGMEHVSEVHRTWWGVDR